MSSQMHVQVALIKRPSNDQNVWKTGKKANQWLEGNDGIFLSQATYDSLNLRRGVQMVGWSNLRNVNIIGGHLRSVTQLD